MKKKKISVAANRTFPIHFMKRKSFGRSSFCFTGPVQWNSLPHEIGQSDSAPALKSALETHLFQTAYSISFPVFPANLLPFLRTL